MTFLQVSWKEVEVADEVRRPFVRVVADCSVAGAVRRQNKLMILEMGRVKERAKQTE